MTSMFLLVQSFGLYPTAEEAAAAYDIGLLLFLGVGHGKLFNALSHKYVNESGQFHSSIQMAGLPEGLLLSVRRWATTHPHVAGVTYTTSVSRMIGMFGVETAPTALLEAHLAGISARSSTIV